MIASVNKYLFLDVDGVLNNAYSFRKDYINNIKYNDLYYAINKRNLYCLRYFCKHTSNLKIILSSSWRLHEQDINNLKRIFEENDICCISSITPRLWNKDRRYYRGDEIQSWMDEHHVKTEQIVIFDDESDMLHLSDRLIQTSFHYALGGLCYCHLKKAWELFKEK